MQTLHFFPILAFHGLILFSYFIFKSLLLNNLKITTSRLVPNLHPLVMKFYRIVKKSGNSSWELFSRRL